MQLSGFSAPLQLHHENELKPCNLKLSVFWIPVPQCTSRAIWTQASRKKQVSPKRNTWSVLYLYDAIYKNPYPFKKRLTFNKVFLCVCFIWGAGPSPLPLSPAMLTTSWSSQGPPRSFRFITISIIPLIIQQQRD